ncbi:MAG: hypothetical protein COB81_07100 [Flavobacteriaceae bacterium]|nr:MAG: hypothetical protein COB81_07100 [Flavobacteriaceae bacterium]
MKKGVFAIMLMFAISVTSCKDVKKETTEPKATEVKAVVKEELTAATFQCPMKCEQEKVYAEAGSCPVCKMDLKEVKVAATHDSHEGHNH